MGILSDIKDEIHYSIKNEMKRKETINELLYQYDKFISDLKKNKSEKEIQNINFLFELNSNKSKHECKFIINTLEKRDEINDFSRILNKIGLDKAEIEETPPFFLEGYSYNNAYINGDYTSKYQIVWVFYTSNQMVIYNCLFDLISDKRIENIHEIFYKDITSISNDISIVKSKEVLSKKEEVELEVLKINIQGQCFEIPLKGLENKEEIVNSMKNKLREKKNY